MDTNTRSQGTVPTGGLRAAKRPITPVAGPYGWAY